MQLIRDIFAANQAARRPVVSFEFFPAKTDEGDRTLLEKHFPRCFKQNLIFVP